MGARRALLIWAAALAATMALAGSAAAAVHLDRTYGHGGIAKVPGKKVPGQRPGAALAMQPDGSLILATNSTLRRLDPAGHIDSGFGEDGTVTPPALDEGTFQIRGAAVDGQGRIVVVGTSTPAQPPGKTLPFHLNWAIEEPHEAAHTDARVMRYLPNGQLDPSFGQGGIVETDFGLPTPEYEGVKIASAPAVEATGVAVDGQGRIVITGGAADGITSDCFHDDYFPTISYAALVGRLTESGALDQSFAAGGVFGGHTKFDNPLGMEDATEPVITAGDGIVFGRGYGHCARGAGSLGFVRLTPEGKVRGSGEQDKLGGRVFDAAAAPDGSLFLLLAPKKADRGDPDLLEKLRPDGTPDPSFGKGGKVVLKLPGESYADQVRVAADGELLISATKVPPYHHEREELWWSKFSPMLVGLTPSGARDPRVGPHGIAVKHIPHWWENGGLFLDAKGRPTITIGYRPSHPKAPLGLAAIRFAFEG
jgi:uncharacterized delta-60 repeat protein